MRHPSLLHLLRQLCMALLALAGCGGSQAGKAPCGAPGPEVVSLHGVSVPDPYRWLADSTDAATIDWVSCEDDRARRYLSWLSTTRKMRLGFMRAERPVLVMEIETAGDHVFWQEYDTTMGMALVKSNKGRFSIGAGNELSISVFEPERMSLVGGPDGYCAVIVEEPTRSMVEVTRADSMQNPSNPFEIRTGSSVAWLPDGSGFYYLEPVPEGHSKLMYHAVTAQRPLAAVPALTAGTIEASSEDTHLLLTGQYTGTNPGTFAALAFDAPAGTAPTLLKTCPTGDIAGDVYRGHAYLCADDGGDLVLERIDLAHPEQRTPLITFPDSPPLHLVFTGDHMVIETEAKGASILAVYDLNGKHQRDLPLPAVGVIETMTVAPDGRIAATFSSPIFPVDFSLYDPETGNVESIHRSAPAVNPSEYDVIQEVAIAADGTEIPLLITKPKGAPMDGSLRTVLSVMGGLGYDSDLAHDWRMTPWLADGGAWAVALIRGGSEKGNRWREAGRGRGKEIAVTDFIACAQTLVEKHYTSPEKLGYFGTSHGGWVVSAAALREPALAKAVVAMSMPTDLLAAEMPFTPNMVYMNTPYFKAEFGTLASEADVLFRKTISPYHLTETLSTHPAFCVIAMADDQIVDPFHSRKLVASLQELQLGPRVLYLEEPFGGHWMDDPALDTFELTCQTLGFLRNELR